jgi:hypothetical protein
LTQGNGENRQEMEKDTFSAKRTERSIANKGLNYF